MRAAREWAFVLSYLFLHTSHILCGLSPEELVSFLSENNKVFCLEANICGIRQDTQHDNTQCCADCSCDEDCHLHGNCCFPSNATHPIDELKTCESLVLGDDGKKIPKLYMISNCPKGNGIPGTRGKCGDIAVTPWGGLFPVFSRSTGMIYKNERCAQCHGVTDATNEAFIVKLACKDTDINFHLMALQANTISPLCTVDVAVHTAYTRDIFKHRCYTNPVDKCAFNNFAIPANLSITLEQIIDSCESGFYSPYISSLYIHDRPFANVFCYICNDQNAFNAMESCIVQESIYKPKQSWLPMTALVTFSYISSRHETPPNIKYVQREADAIGDKSSCRPVMCPSGQTRDNRNGQCSYLLPPTVSSYALLVYLRIPKSSTRGFRGDDIIAADTVINRPLMNLWAIDNLYYSETADDGIVMLFLTMVYTARFIPLSIASRHVNKVMKGKWTMSIKDSFNVERIVQMTPHFYASTFHCLDFRMYPVTEFESAPLHNTTFYWVYDNRQLSMGHMRITKMYFCDQLTLKPGEYVLDESACEIRLTSTNKTLYDNEFSLVPLGDGIIVIRVCIDDIPVRTCKASGKTSATLVTVCCFFTSVVVIVNRLMDQDNPIEASI